MRKLNILLVAAVFYSPNLFAMRNGTFVESKTQPSIGSLFPNCTATLISQNVAITAGHCIFLKGAQQSLTVTQSNGVDVELHPEKVEVLSRVLSREIALVRFKESVSNMQFSKLAESLPPETGEAVGYGYGATGFMPAPFALRKGEFSTTLVATEGGDVLIQVTSTSTDQMPCVGDSGGPLLSRTGELLGILSFGAGAPGDSTYPSKEESTDRCLATKAAYYVPVTPYLDLIRKFVDGQ